MTAMADTFAHGQPPPPHKPVVLVVDDDEFQLKIIEMVLGAELYELHFLSDARQALTWLAGSRADLVIVDVQMPDVDGLEMTRQLKAIPERKAIPILMMSGQGDSAMVQQCLQSGAQDFVVKPFERAKLQAKVAQLLAPRAIASPDAANVAHPGINVAHGLSVWGSAQDYGTFLRKFALTYADCVEHLRDAFARHDHGVAQSLAHKLRGAAGTMALDDVARSAGALETLSTDQDPLPALLQLQRALDVALASIAAYTGHQG